MRVEVGPEEMDASLMHAYQHVVKEVAIPGFRKGKAPRTVVEGYVGRQALRKEALDHLLPEICMEIVREEKLEVVAPPQVEMVQEDPVVFRATFSLRPVIELGDHRALRMERPDPRVEDSQLDGFLENLRERHGAWAPAPRAAQFDDLVIIDVTQAQKGGETRKHEGQQVLLMKDSVIPLPGFSEHLVGLSAGEEKEFTLAYPEDHRLKELAGKEFDFQVRVIEIKEKRLPELSDEFARSLGEGLDSVEALRTHAADVLRRMEQERITREHERKVLAAVVDSAVRLEYPPVFVEEEINRLMRDRDMATRDRGGLRAYMAALGKSEEDLREELRPRAEEQVRHDLVLGKVAEAEQITVEPAEVDADVEAMKKGAGEGNPGLQELFGTAQAREVLENRLYARKALLRLVDIALGNAPDGVEEPAEAGKEANDGDAA